MSLSFIICICTRERISSFKISRKRCCSPDLLTKLSSIAAVSPALLQIRNVYAKRHFCFLFFEEVSGARGRVLYVEKDFLHS